MQNTPQSMGPSSLVTTPTPLPRGETWRSYFGITVNWAVTVFDVSSVTTHGPVVLEHAPDHPVNVESLNGEPVSGSAVNVTTVNWSKTRVDVPQPPPQSIASGLLTT